MKAFLSELDAAMICHEANGALCRAAGDLSQPSWTDAPDWQRDSAVAGVQMHLNQPNATPDASHAAWMAHKLADGWAYGSVKDPEAKTHPCIVPYGDLPAEQQAKDHLFRAIVHGVAPFIFRGAL